VQKHITMMINLGISMIIDDYTNFRSYLTYSHYSLKAAILL
jgi:hypothetical protein